MMAMPPSASEPICLVSYEITRILLGGGPDTRHSFWKTYRNELAFNKKTQYQNDRIRITWKFLLPLQSKLGTPHYFRDGQLHAERTLENPGMSH